MQGKTSSIFSIAQDCLRLVEQISTHVANDLSTESEFRSEWLDEASRFRIWANNIGALLTNEHRNSLDTRLRNAAR